MSKTSNKKDTLADLRKMVFTLQPDDIGISKESFDHPVWGVVMEVGSPEGPFSLVALADGTSRLYFSKGGGIVGRSEHESAQEAYEIFLMGAQTFYTNAEKVEKHVSPSEGKVVFYFLTFDGVLSYSAAEEKLGKRKDELSDYFYSGLAVINELRKTKQN